MVEQWRRLQTFEISKSLKTRLGHVQYNGQLAERHGRLVFGLKNNVQLFDCMSYTPPWQVDFIYIHIYGGSLLARRGQALTCRSATNTRDVGCGGFRHTYLPLSGQCSFRPTVHPLAKKRPCAPRRRCPILFYFIYRPAPHALIGRCYSQQLQGTHKTIAEIAYSIIMGYISRTAIINSYI